jgi:hypothetical protein
LGGDVWRIYFILDVLLVIDVVGMKDLGELEYIHECTVVLGYV